MGMGAGDDGKPEFSFIIRPSEHGENEKLYELEADSYQRGALARRFDLLGIEFFRPRLSFKRLRGSGSYRLDGQVRARVTQRCVVTLEPITSDVDSRFEIHFRTDFQGDRHDMSVDEKVEPLDGDMLDLGEITTEELVMALDPYPRGQDVQLTEFLPEADQIVERKHPFAALAAIKGKK
jgi:uncharacterized metal-binding protein YceD (DUF177 family)